jgi:hypothetical protein
VTKKKGQQKQPTRTFPIRPSLPIDVSYGRCKGKLPGLKSALPRGGSRSIAYRTKTRAKGTTSAGLPSLGKKRK